MQWTRSFTGEGVIKGGVRLQLTQRGAMGANRLELCGSAHHEKFLKLAADRTDSSLCQGHTSQQLCVITPTFVYHDPYSIVISQSRQHYISVPNVWLLKQSAYFKFEDKFSAETVLVIVH